MRGVPLNCRPPWPAVRHRPSPRPSRRPSAGSGPSNPVSRPGEVSTAAFLADRFQFREELTSLTVDEFAERVRTISERVARLSPVQVFTAQQVTVRTLVNPRHFKDSRTYLREGMFGFSDQIESFGRKAELYGLRLVFPPTPEEPNAHALRIESFTSDARSLFLENQASFAPVLEALGSETGAAGVMWGRMYDAASRGRDQAVKVFFHSSHAALSWASRSASSAALVRMAVRSASLRVAKNWRSDSAAARTLPSGRPS